MYKANIVQLVKNISTCTKNIYKFPLNTNFAPSAKGCNRPHGPTVIGLVDS